MPVKKAKDTLQIITTIVFSAFVLWWTWIHFTQPAESNWGAYFSDSYGVLALAGGLFGLFASKKWGGFKSILGKALVFFSLGLLFQAFGQATYTYYAHVLDVEAPYPSIGDVGYFGSIPIYILGVFYLSKTIGAKLSLKSYKGKAWAIALPLLLLSLSYYVFLRGYEFSDSKLVTFLDFGYPLGQAIYVAFALLAYVLSRKLLGGIMRNKILLILFALVVQYFADFTFLYKFNHDEWVAGGVNDLTYLAAYFVLITALLRMRHTNLNKSVPVAETEVQ